MTDPRAEQARLWERLLPVLDDAVGSDRLTHDEAFAVLDMLGKPRKPQDLDDDRCPYVNEYYRANRRLQRDDGWRCGETTRVRHTHTLYAADGERVIDTLGPWILLSNLPDPSGGFAVCDECGSTAHTCPHDDPQRDEEKGR